MHTTLQQLLAQMTLEEKAGLCSGLNAWQTKPVERLGVTSITMADGPHGLRKQADLTAPLGLGQSLPATCFPTAATTACSFDRELLREIGAAIGAEAAQEQVAVVLGPGVNIKRSPLCGRNFEYFSEDPLLAGELAAALVQGIQSRQVGACLKHYAANNQETARMINDSILDERALREIYLAPFEIAVKQSQPWSMMCAYNKVNGSYMCEHERLLTDIPRGEWGFEGAFITDWGAMDERAPALKAGLDLEMPYAGPQRDQAILAAVKSGALDEAVLDRAVLRILELREKSLANPHTGQPGDIAAHNALARRAAGESAVLLKNDGLLPVKAGESLLVVGEFAATPRYQGAGSSKINPHQVTSALETLEAEGIPFEFAHGYDLSGQENAEILISQAAEAARGKQVVLVYAGLPDEYESEGFDRAHIDLPAEQNALIERLAAVNPNLAVVLHGGGAMRLPWLAKVRAVLLLGLGGQSSGAASVDLLFGKVNPSGKLSETYPLELADNPAYLQFGQHLTTQYRESIYVGYRYYDKAEKAVLFPFGHGLSYTKFEYRHLKLSHRSLRDDETLTVSLNVKNVGDRAGKEAVQIYVAPPPSTLFKPQKELRQFGKVSLEPGEEKEISFELGKRAFTYWNVALNDWHVENGSYQVLVGSSSRDIRLQAAVVLQSSAPAAPVPDYRASAPRYYHLPEGTLDIPQEQFEVLCQRQMPPQRRDPKAAFSMNSTLGDARDTRLGKYLYNIFAKKMSAALSSEGAQDTSMQRMAEAMLDDFPLRAFSMGGMSFPLIEGIVLLLNKKYIKAIGKMIKARQASKS
jgi:beta-glucosidase